MSGYLLKRSIKMDRAVLGLFEYADDLLDAAKRLKDSGYDVTILSPVPLVHEMAHKKMSPGKNYLRYFTFFGSAYGLCFGVGLTLITAAMYVLPRGGRPIWFMTPTLLISYETTILLGVLSTFVGFLVLAGLPSYKKKLNDVQVSVDAFGLVIDGNLRGKYDEVERILREYGANEVKRIEEA